MSLYLEYIFRKENLCYNISFPFSIHTIEKNIFKIITCKIKNEKFIIKIWNLSECDEFIMLPKFEEVKTDNFVDYFFSNINPNSIKKINEISYSRSKLSNNSLLEDIVFENYYKLLLYNNIEELKYKKKYDILNYFLKTQNIINKNITIYNIKKQVKNKMYLKWKLWEKYLIDQMFPAEFMFYSSIRN